MAITRSAIPPFGIPYIGNVRDQVIPVLGLLESTERHLGTGYVFLRVLQVFKLRPISIR